MMVFHLTVSDRTFFLLSVVLLFCITIKGSKNIEKTTRNFSEKPHGQS